jgi:dihydropyrimidinase
MTSLIIRGGTVVNHDHSRRADVLVGGETIVAIGSSQPTASTPLPAPPMAISTAGISVISAR